MSKLVLEPNIVMQTLGDPDFYSQCPSYFFMKDQALAVYARWQKAVATGRKDCDNCSDKGLYKPVVKIFADHTVRMFQDDPSLLDPLVRYLTGRLRGKKPDSVILYYRSAAGVESISF